MKIKTILMTLALSTVVSNTSFAEVNKGWHHECSYLTEDNREISHALKVAFGKEGESRVYREMRDEIFGKDSKIAFEYVPGIQINESEYPYRFDAFQGYPKKTYMRRSHAVVIETGNTKEYTWEKVAELECIATLVDLEVSND